MLQLEILLEGPGLIEDLREHHLSDSVSDGTAEPA